MKLGLSFPKRILNSRQKKRFRELLLSEWLRDLYAQLVAIHERNTRNGWTGHGHSLDHDLAVAAFAHAIAFARGAGDDVCLFVMAAGLMHSYDRYRRSEESDEPFTGMDVREWSTRLLPGFSDQIRKEIVEAVLGHDRPNKGKVTSEPGIGDILADADKLANLMFYTLIRTGQYLPTKPTVIIGSLDKMSEGANYRTANSALDNVFGMLEWVDDYSWFVTDEAKEIAKVLEKPLRYFIELNQRQFEALGINELP